jgi:hypothetical protein
MHTFVSTGAGLICIAIAAVLWFPGHRRLPRTTLALVITGYVWLLNTRPGAWIREAISWAARELGRLVGSGPGFTIAAGVILAATAVLALGYVIFHAHERRIDEQTFLAAGVLVFTATSIPGNAGHVIDFLVFGLADIVSWPINAFFGWV